MGENSYPFAFLDEASCRTPHLVVEHRLSVPMFFYLSEVIVVFDVQFFPCLHSTMCQFLVFLLLLSLSSESN